MCEYQNLCANVQVWTISRYKFNRSVRWEKLHMFCEPKSILKLAFSDKALKSRKKLLLL